MRNCRRTNDYGNHCPRSLVGNFFGSAPKLTTLTTFTTFTTFSLATFARLIFILQDWFHNFYNFCIFSCKTPTTFTTFGNFLIRPAPWKSAPTKRWRKISIKNNRYKITDYFQVNNAPGRINAGSRKGENNSLLYCGRAAGRLRRVYGFPGVFIPGGRKTA